MEFCLAALSTEHAPRTSNDRMQRSPALVILPIQVLPPKLYWSGTRPSQAATLKVMLVQSSSENDTPPKSPAIAPADVVARAKVVMITPSLRCPVLDTARG